MPAGRDTFRMVATQNNMLEHGPPTSLLATNNSILTEADLEDRHFGTCFSIVFPVAWSSAVLRPILSVLSSGFCRSPYTRRLVLSMLLPRFFSHASAGTTVSSGAESACVLDENKAAEPLPTLVCLVFFSLARSSALHYVKDQLLYQLWPLTSYK